jgi:hypothetical protein
MVKTFTRKRSSKSEANPLKEKAQPIQKLKADPEKFIKRSHFKKLTEMRNSLKISAVSKFESINLLPFSFVNDEIGSYFFDELERSHALEQSKAWYTLYTELLPISQNLSLILLNKNQIFKLLLGDLSIHCQQNAVLKLLLSLIRDIRGEGYEFFVNEVFESLVELVSSKDDVLELGLQVIGGFLKYCSKAISTDAESFINKVVSLALRDNRPKHVMRILAETISYVFKKNIEEKSSAFVIQRSLTCIADFLSHCSSKSEFWENNLVYFTASFMFEVIRGHQNALDERISLSLGEIHRFCGSLEIGEHSRVFHRSVRFLLYKLMKVEFKFLHVPHKSTEKYFKDFMNILCNRVTSKGNQFWDAYMPGFFADAILFREGLLFKDSLKVLLDGYVRSMSALVINEEQFYLIASIIFRYGSLPVDLADLTFKRGITIEQFSSFVMELMLHSMKSSRNRTIFKEKQVLTHEALSQSPILPVSIIKELITVTFEFLSDPKFMKEENFDILYTIDFIFKQNNIFEKIQVKDLNIQKNIGAVLRNTAGSAKNSENPVWVKNAICVLSFISLTDVLKYTNLSDYLQVLSNIYSSVSKSLQSQKAKTKGISKFTESLMKSYSDFENLDILEMRNDSLEVLNFELFVRVSLALAEVKANIQTSDINSSDVQTKTCLQTFSSTFNSVLSVHGGNYSMFRFVLSYPQLKMLINDSLFTQFSDDTYYGLFSRRQNARKDVLLLLQKNQAINRPFKDSFFIDFLINVK